MELTNEELNQIRQWFNCVQDSTPEYMTDEDFRLARKITEHILENASDLIDIKFNTVVQLPEGVSITYVPWSNPQT